MIHAEVYLGTGMAKPITNIEIKFNRIRRFRAVARKKQGLRQYLWLNSPPSYLGSL